MGSLLKPGSRRVFARGAGALLILLLIIGSLKAASPGEEVPLLKVAGMEEREADPLWRGSLTGAALDSRLKDFAAAVNRREEPALIFNAFLDHLGVKRIIDYMEGRDRSCHGLLHGLGEVLIERTENLKRSMTLCGNACTYACVHGAMKRYFDSVISKKEEAPLKEEVSPLDESGAERGKRRLRREVLALCREDSKIVHDFFIGNCAHAVGHGFAGLSKNLSEARGYCAFFTDEERRYYCESGIFMELRPMLERQIFSGELSTAAKRDIALRFCIQNSEFVSSCLRFLLDPASKPDDIDHFSRQCATLEGKVRKGCFYIVGYISRSYITSQPEEINRVCGSGDPTDRALCIGGLVFVKKDHRLKEALARSCRYLIDPTLKGICVEQRGRFYYQTGNSLIRGMLVDAVSPPEAIERERHVAASVPTMSHPGIDLP